MNALTRTLIALAATLLGLTHCAPTPPAGRVPRTPITRPAPEPRNITIVEGAPVPDLHTGDTLSIILIDGTAEDRQTRCEQMGGYVTLPSNVNITCADVDY